MNKILLALLILLASCHPQKRMARLMDKHPITAAKECDVRWPFVPSTTDTVLTVDSVLLEQYEYEFAYLSHLLDSLLSVGCDSATAIRVVELIKSKPCPPQPVKIITREIESTRRLAVVRDSCTQVAVKLNKELASITQKATDLDMKAKRLEHFNKKLRKQRNTYLWLLIALLVFTFRKPIFSLVKKFI